MAAGGHAPPAATPGSRGTPRGRGRLTVQLRPASQFLRFLTYVNTAACDSAPTVCGAEAPGGGYPATVAHRRWIAASRCLSPTNMQAWRIRCLQLARGYRALCKIKVPRCNCRVCCGRLDSSIPADPLRALRMSPQLRPRCELSCSDGPVVAQTEAKAADDAAACDCWAVRYFWSKPCRVKASTTDSGSRASDLVKPPGL